MKAINGVGVVIAVLVGFILVLPKTKDAGVGFAETQHVFYYLLPLPALMILSYKRILLDPAQRRIRITKGIWPITVQSEIPFENSAEIQLDAMKGRWISYSAFLSVPSQKKPLLIFADGDEDQLRTILDFAQQAGFRLQAKEGMRKLAPDWVRSLAPELTQSSSSVS